MTGKKTVKHAVVPVPRTLEETAEFVARIGKAQREMSQIQNSVTEKVEKLKAKAMADSQPLEEEVSRLVEGIFAFAESRRDKLTDGGKRKTVELPTGTFGWRWTPPSVLIRNTESVLKNLKSLGLQRFIRTKPEIDKEAMLKEQEVAKTVKGVSISQHEEFAVKPSELQVEIASKVDKLKKAAS
jgi:phage host-nuclease inhibitor protein Gam